MQKFLWTAELKTKLLIASIAVIISTSTGCGDPITCWCSCPPAGSSYEYTRTSSTPLTCDQLCAEYGCWYEGETECNAGQTQSCRCDNGNAGNQTCGTNEMWGLCTNCDALCLESDRQPCTCESGGTGLQTCTGGSWSLCEGCVTGCTEGVTQRCLCEGGLEGSQRCTGGEWSECSDCATPTTCTEGEVEACSCSTGDEAERRCVDGVWGLCEGCYGEAYGDIDFGTSGMSTGGTSVDVFDMTEWGCDPMAPGDDNLVWRLHINDGVESDTIWFEFDLPAFITDLEVTYWHMSMTDGDSSSDMEILFNGVSHGEDFAPTVDCVDYESFSYLSDSLVLGGTNRIEAWTHDTGLGLNHGLQGVWVSYTFSE